MEHFHPEWSQALQIGKYNESVIAHEFAYQGIPLIPTEGKNDFDFHLPDGRSLEVKIDLRSQCTGYGAIEWPTLQRGADFYVYSLTYARVFTHAELNQLYLGGKSLDGGVGDLNYNARLVKRMGQYGMPLYEFIKLLKLQRS